MRPVLKLLREATFHPFNFKTIAASKLAKKHKEFRHVAQLSGVQDQKRSNDAVATTAAVIIFWPAAFLVGGNDQTTAELARMKGEFEAVEKVSIQKNCGIQFQKAPPPAPVAVAPESHMKM